MMSFPDNNICHAAERCDLETLKHTVSKRFFRVNYADHNNNTALHFAAEKGFLEGIVYLVEQGANVNVLNAFEYSPLHKAIFARNIECVKYLVEHGANLHKRTCYRETPLHCAAHIGDPRCVKYLIDKGAKVNTSSDNEETPLQEACRRNLECVKLLVQAGAHVNPKTYQRCWSPLRVASIWSREICTYLLQQGADPFGDIKKGSGDHPIILARKTYKERLVIQAMVSAKTHRRLGHRSRLTLLSTDIIHRLHAYIV
jgi:ankyrin repeat protein